MCVVSLTWTLSDCPRRSFVVGPAATMTENSALIRRLLRDRRLTTDPIPAVAAGRARDPACPCVVTVRESDTPDSRLRTADSHFEAATDRQGATGCAGAPIKLFSSARSWRPPAIHAGPGMSPRRTRPTGIFPIIGRPVSRRRVLEGARIVVRARVNAAATSAAG